MNKGHKISRTEHKKNSMHVYQTPDRREYVTPIDSDRTDYWEANPD